MVKYKRQGVLPVDMMVDGKRLQARVPARIIPGFGVDVLPECYFLKKGFTINKSGPICEISTPAGQTILRASALEQDKSWLFYVRVQVAAKHDATHIIAVPPLKPSRPSNWDVLI